MHAARLAEVGEFLLRTRPLWGAQPFMKESLPWEERWPELSSWLRSLGPDEIEAFEKSPQSHPGCSKPLEEWQRASESLCALLPLPRTGFDAGPRDSWWVKERKWKQVQAFSGCAFALASRSGGIVDWCAGKGHLGRLLGHWSQRTFLALEKEEALCGSGHELAMKAGVEAICYGCRMSPQEIEVDRALALDL